MVWMQPAHTAAQLHVQSCTRAIVGGWVQGGMEHQARARGASQDAAFVKTSRRS